MMSKTQLMLSVVGGVKKFCLNILFFLLFVAEAVVAAVDATINSYLSNWLRIRHREEMILRMPLYGHGEGQHLDTNTNRKET